jgi:hypothetical protein
MSLRRVLHPVVLLLAPVAASALAWSVPGSSTALRGFAHRAEAAPGGLALLVAWYLMCATILVLGHRIGAATPPAASLARYETDPVLERRLFRLLWGLAAVGVRYSLVRAAATVDVLAALGGGTGDELTAALDGQAGPATLPRWPSRSGCTCGDADRSGCPRSWGAPAAGKASEPRMDRPRPAPSTRQPERSLTAASHPRADVPVPRNVEGDVGSVFLDHRPRQLPDYAEGARLRAARGRRAGIAPHPPAKAFGDRTIPAVIRTSEQGAR